MVRSSILPASEPPRRPWWLAALLVATQATCKAPNPAFDAGATSAVDSAQTDPTDPTTSAPATTDGTTADPATSPSTTDDSTSTDPPPDPETESTTAEANRCCNADDCDPQVIVCVCALMESCCEEWGEFCPDMAAACAGTCDGVEASCCRPRPDHPACDGVALAEGFCATHVACCDDEWTPRCVAEYDAATGECDLGSCSLPQDLPGCADPDIMDCVCEELPQCCTEQWDTSCVQASAVC